ncbi:MAG: hypothetical protein EA408_11280 [Marinilabiliales bacterium]|nr:MAG: hypothetical protein EA408_11280 [Marinilabiliales bacterium]
MKSKSLAGGRKEKIFPVAALLLVSIILSGACTRNVYVPVLMPAPVDIGAHIQTVAVVDRTTPGEGAGSKQGESQSARQSSLHREASQKAVEGLVRTLEVSPKYTAVTRTAERLTTPAEKGSWPPPLSWTEIESLAERYDSDVVLVLETFDTDFMITDGGIMSASTGTPRSVSNAGDGSRSRDRGGSDLSGSRVRAGGMAGIKLGFRVYDPVNRSIADEFMFNHYARWEAQGNPLQMVVGGIIDHRMAVIDASYESGAIYGERISPLWITLERDFFTKGGRNTDFNTGVRRATVNDWEGARQAWNISADDPKRKTAGRSAYNLALMHEIDGDLDLALEWARYSYSDYRIRRARDYAQRLEVRIRERQIAGEQFR